MRKTITLRSDTALKSEHIGCIINGELHVAPAVYDRIYNQADTANETLLNLEIIDVDERVYIETLDDIRIFAGQQVKVYDQGFYLGDGTVTCYPYQMKFELAEVTMHFPFKGQSLVTRISSMSPIRS
jgi:hypothetical protein